MAKALGIVSEMLEKCNLAKENIDYVNTAVASLNNIRSLSYVPSKSLLVNHA